MFAEHYASEIDWTHLRNCLKEVHAFDFARALFHILQSYLLPDARFLGYIIEGDEIDVEPLLADILAGGVHGNSSLERLHSSNITLHAVAQDKKGGPSAGTGFLSTAVHAAFLPLKEMTVHYPYLKKAPFLLPIAWVQRNFKYLRERISDWSGGKGSTSESIRLGQSRVELLKKYGIIK